MTNDIKEIGGYFGLELVSQRNDDSFALNSARNCLRYVVRAYNIKEIYLPFYTCPVVWNALNREDCKIHFYHIDENFYPTIEFPPEAYVLYTNYFGVCAKNVKKLAKKYKNLIIDNAQAFYMPKYGIASFNSVRKFFGVSDGAYLYCDKTPSSAKTAIDSDNKAQSTPLEQDTSYQRFSHLLKRIDVNAQFGYDDFCKNDDSLINEDIKLMSNLTRTIINSIDTVSAKKSRLENFNTLHNALKETNELVLELEKEDVPMVYPYLIKQENLKQRLIKNKIYVATYWSPMPKEYNEGIFQKYLVPLPLDQRYGREEMERIIEVINE